MGVEAFSLFERQMEWVQRQPKGKRSQAVRRAIDFYQGNQVETLMAARDKLQEIVLRQDADIEKLKVTRKAGGRRLFLAFLAGYILPHALDLLEYAL